MRNPELCSTGKHINLWCINWNSYPECWFKLKMVSFLCFYNCHDRESSLTKVGGRKEELCNCFPPSSYSFLNLSSKLLKGNSLNNSLFISQPEWKNKGVCYPQITFRWEIFIELSLEFIQIFGNKLGNINSKPSLVYMYNAGKAMKHMKYSFIYHPVLLCFYLCCKAETGSHWALQLHNKLT